MLVVVPANEQSLVRKRMNPAAPPPAPPDPERQVDPRAVPFPGGAVGLRTAPPYPPVPPMQLHPPPAPGKPPSAASAGRQGVHDEHSPLPPPPPPPFARTVHSFGKRTTGASTRMVPPAPPPLAGSELEREPRPAPPIATSPQSVGPAKVTRSPATSIMAPPPGALVAPLPPQRGTSCATN